MISEFTLYILCRVKKYIFNNLEPYYKQIVKRRGGGGLKYLRKKLPSHFCRGNSKAEELP